MQPSDELGFAFAPIVAASVAAPAFGSGWLYAFGIAVLFAQLVTLLFGWPPLVLLRRWNLCRPHHFILVGLVLASPAAWLVSVYYSPKSAVPFLHPLLVLFAGVVGSLAFWRFVERPRRAL